MSLFQLGGPSRQWRPDACCFVFHLRPGLLLQSALAVGARLDGRGRAFLVSCYLCAYLRAESPEDSQALPQESPVGVHEDLGTCFKCSIWACSAHGSRYGEFECAICTPGAAAEDALSATSVGGPAAVAAHLTGMNADDALRGQVTVAMQNVVSASQQPAQAAGGRSLVAPGRGEPNLITNLADLIRQQQLREGHPRVGLVGARGDGFELVSLDVVGGAVRERLTGRMLAAPVDEAVTTVTGALLLGYSLAEPDIAARRLENPVSWPEGISRLSRPWLVSRPIFLDPVLWMLGTALPEG